MRDSNVKIENRILLKKAAREGCSESLVAIYTKYQPAICDFLRKIGADGDSEDICQLVFMEVFEGKCKYDGSSAPKTFLFGVANNIHKNGVRANKTETYGLSPEGIEGEILVSQISNTCLHNALENAEIHQTIKDMVAQLPRKTQKAIELIYLEGKTRQETADYLGSDYFAVCSSIKYGRNKLKEKISEVD